MLKEIANTDYLCPIADLDPLKKTELFDCMTIATTIELNTQNVSVHTHF